MMKNKEVARNEQPFCLLMQLMVMPMMGMGIFSSNAPDALKMEMGSLIGHLVYGLVLGLTTKPTQN